MLGHQRGIHGERPQPCGAAGRAERLVLTGEGCFEEGGVVEDVSAPLRGHVILVVDRLHRADWTSPRSV